MGKKRRDRGDYHRRYRQRRKQAGLCARCNEGEKLEHGSRCSTCYYKAAALRHLGDSSRWQELEALFHKQRGRCAYTFRALVLGRSASLEHVRPFSRDPLGASDITNLKWIDVGVNRAKNDMSLEDFVRMCIKVVESFGYDVVRDDSK